MEFVFSTAKHCQTVIASCFDTIRSECRSVLASELHYQAMIYHILRNKTKFPLTQIGMNVKITIENPSTKFLQKKIKTKNEKFQHYGIEITPDISFFSKEINADWRRRNYKYTLQKTLYAMEVKVSERHHKRIVFSEIKNDILKLKAQKEETFFLHKKTSVLVS